jgi:hypothetical protein
MSFTYINRKGVTYILCRTTTKTGKPRYVFAREPKGEPLDEIPEGWCISESVNGIVSLVRDRPSQILPEELAAVEAAVARHPKARNYRVTARRDHVLVYERQGSDAEEIAGAFAGLGLGVGGRLGQLREILDQGAQFTPVLRFVVEDDDAAQRTFHTERWCHLGSIDDWIYVGTSGPLDQLVREWIPRLGSDKFFEVL